MSNNIVPILIAFAGGLYIIAASILNWDFFFSHRRTSFFVRVFGRTGARIFYAILGLVLILIGIKMVW